MSRYDKDSLGTRMKEYENVPKTYLDQSLPVIIRLDMRAGHSFCKRFHHPFDTVFSISMQGASEMLVEEVPGCRLAYVQSDEISLVLNGIDKNGEHHILFDGGVEKLVSVTASIATLGFNKTFTEFVEVLKGKDIDVSIYEPKLWTAQFDSRAFNLPDVNEVRNYLMWRIMDARRNSVSVIGRSQFSQKELDGKSVEEVAKMLEEAGKPIENWSRMNRHGKVVAPYAYDKEAVNPKTGETLVVERHGWKPFSFDVEDITFEWVEGIYDGAYMRWVPNECAIKEPDGDDVPSTR